MKKRIYLGLFLSIFCQVCALNVGAQNNLLKDDFGKLSFDVNLNKNDYFPLEPLFAQVKVTNNTDKSLNILSTPDFKRLYLIVKFGGKRKVFNTLFLTSGSRPGFGIVIDKGQSIDADIVLETYLAEIFPEYGQYQIQFVLSNGKTEKLRKEIRSDIKEIIIKEPFGINKEAIEFLRQNQEQSLFWWKESGEQESIEKNGRPLIEEFVNKYSETVFGELAVYQLGIHYLNGGYIEPAKLEFEKIKNSTNKYVADKAKSSLAEIRLNQKQ